VALLRVLDGGRAYLRVFLPAVRKVFERVRDYSAGFNIDVDDLWTAPQTLAATRDSIARMFKRSDG
jgi:hypothetical protein